MDFANLRKISKNLQIIELPVEKIKYFKLRTREEKAFNDLRNSIQESGLKYPIGVRKIKKSRSSDHDMGYEYECIKGHGRLLACSSLGWKAIPSIVYEVDDMESVLLYILENENRQKLPSVDTARLMRIEADQGVSNDEIARKFHLSPGTVRQYIGFAKSASQKTIETIRENKITFEDGMHLSTLSREEQGSVVDMINTVAKTKQEAKTIIRNTKEIKRNNAETKIKEIDLRRELTDLRFRLKTRQGIFNELAYIWNVSFCALVKLLKNEKFRKLLDKSHIDYSVINFDKETIDAK